MQLRFDTTTKKVFAAAVLLAGISLGISWYVARTEDAIATELRTLITAQSTTLMTLAEATDTDGADSVVDAIVKDCTAPERERFDTLLSNLQNLRGAELAEVDRLFARCGDYYATRKAMMVTRLEREFAVYQSYIALLNNVDGRAETVTYPIDNWQSLLALEQSRTEYTMELVKIQGAIIAALLAGEPVSGAVITAELAAAKEVKDNLSLAGVQVDTLRQQMLNL